MYIVRPSFVPHDIKRVHVPHSFNRLQCNLALARNTLHVCTMYHNFVDRRTFNARTKYDSYIFMYINLYHIIRPSTNIGRNILNLHGPDNLKNFYLKKKKKNQCNVLTFYTVIRSLYKLYMYMEMYMYLILI